MDSIRSHIANRSNSTKTSSSSSKETQRTSKKISQKSTSHKPPAWTKLSRQTIHNKYLIIPPPLCTSSITQHSLRHHSSSKISTISSKEQNKDSSPVSQTGKKTPRSHSETNSQRSTQRQSWGNIHHNPPPTYAPSRNHSPRGRIDHIIGSHHQPLLNRSPRRKDQRQGPRISLIYLIKIPENMARQKLSDRPTIIIHAKKLKEIAKDEGITYRTAQRRKDLFAQVVVHF